MKNNKYHQTYFLIAPLLFIALLLSSCSVLLAGVEPSPGPQYSATNAAQTVVAVLTQIAQQNTPTSQPTEVTPTATSTTVPATQTPVPTRTPMPTPTKTPVPCDRVQFVKDVSVEDGTKLHPGERFRKIWRLKNIGSCTWSPEYDLVFTGGDRLGAEAVISISDYILPGTTADLYVELKAPEEVGSYRGYWQLRNAQGLLFGLGNHNDTSFWVDIEVTKPQRKLYYDFARNYCDAYWQSGAGNLGCGAGTDNNGSFVFYLEDPKLENRQENEPTLWVHPDHQESGWISGTYPVIKIKDGDRFRAWIGCMDGNEGCRVNFHLDYQNASGGPIKNLASWKEAFEGKVTVIDLDLSRLAGKKVKFILSVTVENNKPEEANAFWFVPRIDRVVK